MKGRAKHKTKARLIHRRKRMKMIFLASFFSALAPLAGLFCWISYYPPLNIQNIEVRGVTTLRANTLKAFVDSKLSDGKLHLFSNKFAPTIPRKRLSGELLAAYPRIKSVEIPFTKFSNTLLVLIKERKPAYIWCNNEEDGKSCYKVDGDGYIYADADSDFTEDLPVILSGMKKKNMPIRSFVLPSVLWESLETLISGIKNDSNLNMDFARTYGTDAHIVFKDGWFVKFALDSDVRRQLHNLDMVLKSAELANVRNGIEYIDVRFGNRVYYKLNE